MCLTLRSSRCHLAAGARFGFTPRLSDALTFAQQTRLDAHPKLNLRRVRRWVREFSAALEMPEILNDLENILTQWRKRKK